MFQAVRSSQIYVNEDTMASSGYTLEQISRFILDYTHEQGNPDDAAAPARGRTLRARVLGRVPDLADATVSTACRRPEGERLGPEHRRVAYPFAGSQRFPDARAS